ncbi:pilus assembly protein PilM [Romboutsia sp.]|uniref:pilus assembly protein PilM n=1 Tax=Romboutsia sp. TaxID=1965302 RepID=UPI002B54F631|nr:pilus assembly protein PilM [Romboutsia sp.]HSQ88773.1 pilus assembly protein PilM [Romboutsia sp.]
MLVAEIIRNEVQGVEKSYKDIVYNIQDDKTIIRNIEVLNVKNKRDILKMIEFEIIQYIPINLNDYIMKYKKIKLNEHKLNLQVILIPKSMIELCNCISKKLKSKARILNVNCDILQKILSLNLIQGFSQSGIFIECKDREFILNMVKDNQVYESHVLPRTIHSYESVVNSIRDFENVYYYGNYDPFIENYLGDEFIVQPLRLTENIKLTKNESVISNADINHINSIGMII